MGHVARSRASRWLTRAFVAAYEVDLDEAEGTLEDYPTLEALFTRRLKPGRRPVDPSPGAMVSPVDGTCAFAGQSQGGRVEVAPGQQLHLDALLGQPLQGERSVFVLYLSPRDYHRVHVPREGEAIGWSYVPGTLWPVFPAAVRRVPNLFSRNERAIVQLQTDEGPIDVVLVGAFGVGRISLSVCDLITNTGGAQASGTLPALPLERGGDLGTFHLGSTVVLVAEPERWSPLVSPGEPVRVGQPLARVQR